MLIPQGWMLKRGKINIAWKKRYFVLSLANGTDYKLTYYKTFPYSGVDSLGSVDLMTVINVFKVALPNGSAAGTTAQGNEIIVFAIAANDVFVGFHGVIVLLLFPDSFMSLLLHVNSIIMSR